jgi:hypothetical protein
MLDEGDVSSSISSISLVFAIGLRTLQTREKSCKIPFDDDETVTKLEKARALSASVWNLTKQMLQYHANWQPLYSQLVCLSI